MGTPEFVAGLLIGFIVGGSVCSLAAYAYVQKTAIARVVDALRAELSPRDRGVVYQIRE